MEGTQVQTNLQKIALIETAEELMDCPANRIVRLGGRISKVIKATKARVVRNTKRELSSGIRVVLDMYDPRKREIARNYFFPLIGGRLLNYKHKRIPIADTLYANWTGEQLEQIAV